jgi:hypothetical protein
VNDGGGFSGRETSSTCTSALALCAVSRVSKMNDSKEQVMPQNQTLEFKGFRPSTALNNYRDKGVGGTSCPSAFLGKLLQVHSRISPLIGSGLSSLTSLQTPLRHFDFFASIVYLLDYRTSILRFLCLCKRKSAYSPPDHLLILHRSRPLRIRVHPRI